MPILPLDHPEPFAATLGVMLYPATDSADTARARAFASQMLAEPIRQFHEAGYVLSYDALKRIATDAGQPLIDLARAIGVSTAEAHSSLLRANTRPTRFLSNKPARVCTGAGTQGQA